MTDAEIIKALEDNEIKKALKCCREEDCYGCPYFLKDECTNYLTGDALDLINRQKAELQETRRDLLNEIVSLEYQLKTAKAEAIKEFAERLIELYTDEHITDDMYCSIGVIKQNIYDVKKIMVGENK